MAADRPGLRHELKLVGEALLLPGVRARLLRDELGLAPVHHPRRVHSLYLDTHEGRALEENLAGVSRRSKLRLRWYGEQQTLVEGSLELKQRENQLGWKEQVALDAPIAVEGRARWAFVEDLRERVPVDWRARLGGDLEPAQWLHYQREYLATPDGRVRVTLDHDLRAFDQRFTASLGARWATPTPDLGIVEVKVAPDDLELARALVERLPLRVDKSSKFVLASCPADGPLRHTLAG